MTQPLAILQRLCVLVMILTLTMSIKLKKVCLQMALSTKSLCPSSVYESVYQTILSISESTCICSALIGGGHTGHLVNCEEMKLCKILGLNVKLENYESIFSPIMTVKREENLLKCDKCEVRSSR